MTERIIDKLDRLGAEAEIKEMTPEIRRFALLVRQDVVAGWPKRPYRPLQDNGSKYFGAWDKADEALNKMAENARELGLDYEPEQMTTTENNGGKTGWPPGLLQDDCKGLSKWLANKPDAKRRVREALDKKRPQNCGTGYCSCIECVMEPAVPDALIASDGESAEYMAGWNDCRQAMLSAKRVGV